MHHLTTFCRPFPPSMALSVATVRSHATACARYQQFVKRCAAAALLTRNDQGVMGSWWGVPAGLASSPLQHHDTRPPGTRDMANACAYSVDARRCEIAQRRLAGRTAPAAKSDLNDRGLGRTVESHSGGLAALRAVLELERGGSGGGSGSGSGGGSGGRRRDGIQ